MNAKCACKMHTGTPVFQMMLHCRIQVDYDKLSVKMLEYVIEKGANLGGKISTRHVDLNRCTGGGVSCAMLDLILSIKRIDCAKAPCTGNDDSRHVTNFSHVDGFENSRFLHSSLDRQLRLSIGKFSDQK